MEFTYRPLLLGRRFTFLLLRFLPFYAFLPSVFYIEHLGKNCWGIEFSVCTMRNLDVLVQPRGWWLFTFDCFVAYKTAILIFMRCSFKKDPNRTTDKFMVFVFLNLCFEFFHLGRNSFEVWNASTVNFLFNELGYNEIRRIKKQWRGPVISL